MRFSVVFGLLFALQATALQIGRQPISQLKKQAEARKAKRALARRDVDPTTLYPAYNISTPIDHFRNESRYAPHSNGTFNVRYWFDDSNYKPGGPVFVLLGGEDFGEDRLPYLQKGIISIVTKATNGLGVVLEHRYYGESFPVPDLSTKNLRFLSTEQALADVDYFARNVKFPGVDADLTAPGTPWIVYGGSYAGAQSAFLRVTYPDTFFGAISSSGVTESIYDYWQYFEPIRQFAPPDTVSATQLIVDVTDNILLGKNNTAEVQAYKKAWGLAGVTSNQDFANVLSYGITGWQSTNWDPAVNSPSFFYYGTNLSTTLLGADNPTLRTAIQGFLSSAGYAQSTANENIFLNAISYWNTTYVSTCTSADQNECFEVNNATYLALDSLDTYSPRSWNYQVCTEWGYFQTGDTPADIKPLVSRTLDLPYLTEFCKLAYNITTRPDIDRVNKYGGFNISYSRLAIIGGNADPWRPATPLADEAPKRTSTVDQPVWEIAHAVHHWDENGLFPNETTPILPPNQIVFAHQWLKNAVVDWLKEWNTDHYEL